MSTKPVKGILEVQALQYDGKNTQQIIDIVKCPHKNLCNDNGKLVADTGMGYADVPLGGWYLAKEDWMYSTIQFNNEQFEKHFIPKQHEEQTHTKNPDEVVWTFKNGTYVIHEPKQPEEQAHTKNPNEIECTAQARRVGQFLTVYEKEQQNNRAFAVVIPDEDLRWAIYNNDVIVNPIESYVIFKGKRHDLYVQEIDPKLRVNSELHRVYSMYVKSKQFESISAKSSSKG